MSKHNPGPWVADMVGTTGRTDVFDCDGRIICILDENEPGDQGVANARLIAAAPELLECAKAGLALFETYALHGENFEKWAEESDAPPSVVKDTMARHKAFKAAIAKAEGR